MKVPLPPGATKGVVTVGVREKATGKTETARRYRFATVGRAAPCPPTAVAGRQPYRRLNNLCSEVLSATLEAGGTNRFVFAMSRDGWSFTAVKGRMGDGFTVRIDGQDVIWRDTPRWETFRLLAAGEHELEVAGVEDGRVVVREIAEILNYCPGVNSKVKENPPYDWARRQRSCSWKGESPPTLLPKIFSC